MREAGRTTNEQVIFSIYDLSSRGQCILLGPPPCKGKVHLFIDNDDVPHIVETKYDGGSLSRERAFFFLDSRPSYCETPTFIGQF